MIGFFPDPYPDELLYSVCARYSSQVNYPNKHIAMKDLFGKIGLSAIVDFPTRLNLLLSLIPYHNYSADEIINKHTLFPFYEPFLSRERATSIREEMKSLCENHLQTKLATNIHQVTAPKFLRFCSLCLEQDRKEYGETYWHRVHQLSGILVCPVHRCFLENSLIKWERESSKFFHCAERELNKKNPQYLDDSDFAHQVFLGFAISAQWLLSQKELSLEQGKLRERYHNLLLKKGYAFYNGNIRGSKLYEKFIEYFPPELLKTIGCSLNSSYRTWLPKLVSKSLADTLYHPIRHLLLLKFLDIEVKQVFTAFVEFKPFGSPPYPCLNKVATHYKELTINTCKISDNTVKGKKIRRPVAMFECNCGFTYQRTGPDENYDDLFRYTKVRDYGKYWETEISVHWRNLNLSLSEIARRFGTTTLLVARHAIRLNLPMNTEGTRSLTGYIRNRNPITYLSEKTQKSRNQWLKIIEKYPASSRQKLEKKVTTLYLWLQRNDSEWFNAHLPEQVTINRKIDLLDWTKIDVDLACKIQTVCDAIRSESKKLTRVSITEIIKRVGYKKWIDKRHQKLPKTTHLINEQLETIEDFMIRKLAPAERYFIMRRRVPKREQLIRRAIINNSTTHNSPKVQREINNSLNRIESTVMLKK